MNKILVWILLITAGMVFSCAQKESSQKVEIKSLPATPPELTQGEKLFQAYCAGCHGEKASGTGQGPSFLSPIYHPNHHGDESFILAARNGVRAHHWQFGNMPALPDVREEEVNQIVAYVRWLQRQAGIF